MTTLQEEGDDASAFLGQTPAAVIGHLTDELSILGHEDHPAMAAVLEKAHAADFVAALLPDAGAPIVEASYYLAWEGNDCHARFATESHAFSLSYQTS